ncbi:unnamed protein product [Echinostoma caproni]|uniref:Endo/exonuclease/phosphatase domain-containing protein n=1 Tax=Echinostoma caproni TaxID=27848 RepID=A0A183A6G5_9TREM|nr:unnamed protein product [Echinostoma caproni]
MRLILFVGVLVVLVWPYQAYLISSFNIQVFGDKKMTNQEVVNILLEILKRYDLVCIQEIRDSDGDSFQKLVALLNEKFDRKNMYSSYAGDRLGRTNSKEQYGLIYKSKMFEVTDQRTYPNHQSRFERPPMQAHVTPKSAGIPNFELLVVHLDPQKVAEEMEALYDVAEEIKAKGKQNIMILGDMNAGCSYLSKKAKRNLRFVTDSSYTWLVGDDMDTTVGKSSCAYDRSVID